MARGEGEDGAASHLCRGLCRAEEPALLSAGWKMPRDTRASPEVLDQLLERERDPRQEPDPQLGAQKGSRRVWCSEGAPGGSLSPLQLRCGEQAQ